ncbi:prolyl oligopeptidase family serine peptidase, partial [Gemmatimonadota bacterium]
TNPRGSSGYGSAFGNEINNAYPDKDFDDLMAGVDAVIAKGFIDEDNLFVYGGSGGGGWGERPAVPWGWSPAAEGAPCSY